METEYDAPVIIGDRNALKITVTHDLGDRTLVVVILLAIVIGACGLVMGLNLAKQSALDLKAAELSAKMQVHANQNSRIEAKLQEIEHVRR